MTLKELQIGKSAIVEAVGGAGALRQHFLDMGLIPGEEVTLVKFAPMGDPMELSIHGYELTLRLDDAARIGVTLAKAPAAKKAAAESEKPVEHPGLGEGGRYHTKKGENPLPDGTTLTFALAGNQNCGKTTLFNQLTGSNQHVGNFPGVTVDQKSGQVRGQKDCTVVDLPGIYSLRPYTAEEIVTRNFILNQKPDCIINIVDATNLERNLYLTLQLLTLQTPTVLALNMMDELTGNGGSVDTTLLSELLGVPVVPICAANGEGVEELIEIAVRAARLRQKPSVYDFCPKGPVHRCIHAVCHVIEDHAQAAGIAVRFAATKLIEGDEAIADELQLDPNELELIEHSVVQMEQERGLDRNAALADMRYSFIENAVAQAVVKPHESREHARSSRLDRVLTGKYTAIPVFLGVMLLIFYLTFNVIGAGLQSLLGGKAGAQNVLAVLSRYWRPVYCTNDTLGDQLAARLRAQLLSGGTLSGLSEDYVYRIRRHGATGLCVVLQQPQVFTRSTMRLLYTVSISCALICIGVCVVMSFQMSRQIFRPIGQLHNALQQVGKNNLEVHVPVLQSDELGELAQQFNRMVIDLKRNQQLLVDNQRALNEAQIRMLQAQLNPHFLCNTLDTMKWISKINQVPQVALMSTDLADILRFCIRPEEFVSLRQEVEVLKRYMEIQRIRLADSFTFSVEVPAELEDCLVPKMMLQPLAENAVLHGLSGVDGGRLEVTVSAADGVLRICVADNGAGLPQELLGKYRPHAAGEGHLGLFNVDTILQKHYGAEFGLFLANRAEGAGAVITATLPVTRREASDHAEGTGR